MSSYEDEIEDLRKEIAAKHHVSIGRDDPILVLQTINNRLMHNSSKAQQEQLQAFSSQLETISQRWSHDAKSKAERALSASVNAATEAAQKVLEDTSAIASAMIRSEVTTGSQRLSKVLKRSLLVANLNLVASLLTVIAVVVAVVGFWHRG